MPPWNGDALSASVSERCPYYERPSASRPRAPRAASNESGPGGFPGAAMVAGDGYRQLSETMGKASRSSARNILQGTPHSKARRGPVKILDRATSAWTSGRHLLDQIAQHPDDVGAVLAAQGVQLALQADDQGRHGAA